MNAPLPIEKRDRRAVEGQAVTFATEFETRDGSFGPAHLALGPFDVSASRTCVMVHRARIYTRAQFDALIRALELAWNDKDVLR